MDKHLPGGHGMITQRMIQQRIIAGTKINGIKYPEGIKGIAWENGAFTLSNFSPKLLNQCPYKIKEEDLKIIFDLLE